MTIEELPAYVHGDCCENKHFLSFNRDVQGKWSIGYIEFGEGAAIGGLALNHCDTLQEATVRMHHAIDRWKRRGSDASTTEFQDTPR